jgi:hypothetical protein
MHAVCQYRGAGILTLSATLVGARSMEAVGAPSANRLQSAISGR